jgi:hypothetical protein
MEPFDLGFAFRAGALSCWTSSSNCRYRPDFAQHVGHALPAAALWKAPEFVGHRWGVAIDSTRCTGCSARVVGCQAEKNVPFVFWVEIGHAGAIISATLFRFRQKLKPVRGGLLRPTRG